MRAELEKRDQNWLNSLAHCKQSFHLMTYEQVNSRTLMSVKLIYVLSSFHMLIRATVG